MPNPVLVLLQPSNHSLLAEWTNSPYVGVYGASLIVVNTITNIMSYYPLTEAEGLGESYTIDGLTNGDTYTVCYQQVEPTASSIPLVSNSLSAAPCTISQPIIINSILISTTTVATATVTFPQDTGGVPLTGLIFTLLNETTGQISSQHFFLAAPPVSLSYSLDVINGNEYVISCQAINAAGYSALSNSVLFNNNPDIPPTPVFNDVVSGFNQAVQFVFTPVQFVPPLSTAQFSYKQEPSGGWTNFTSTYNLSTWVSGQTLTILSSSLGPNLTNGVNYSFRYRVTSGAYNSEYSAILTGVPANPSSFSLPILTVDHNSEFVPSQLISGWDFAQGTFPAPTVSADFSYVVAGISLISTVITNAFGENAELPVTGLTPGSDCSVALQLQTLIPPVNQQYWRNLPLNNIILFPTILAASSQVTTLPGAVTNITYISGEPTAGQGAIQFFWNEPTDIGHTLLTGYVLKLYTVYPSATSTAAVTAPIGNVENYTFTGLSLTGAYWVTIAAINSVGTGPSTQSPAGTTGIYIQQISIPTPTVTASVSGTNVTIGYTVAAGSGFTYVDFDIYSISPTGSTTWLSTQSYVTGQYTYSFTYPITGPPGVYSFGVVSNVMVTSSSPSYASTSLMGTANATVAGAPIVGVPAFSADSTGLGIVKVSINKNGSNILDGLLFILPSAADSSADPVNILTAANVAEINNATTQPYLFSYQLSYQIDTAPGYLISMNNASGSGISYGNLIA
jgi:hypothetical protein